MLTYICIYIYIYIYIYYWSDKLLHYPSQDLNYEKYNSQHVIIYMLLI